MKRCNALKKEHTAKETSSTYTSCTQSYPTQDLHRTYFAISTEIKTPLSGLSISPLFRGSLKSTRSRRHLEILRELLLPRRNTNVSEIATRWAELEWSDSEHESSVLKHSGLRDRLLVAGSSPAAIHARGIRGQTRSTYALRPLHLPIAGVLYVNGHRERYFRCRRAILREIEGRKRNCPRMGKEERRVEGGASRDVADNAKRNI
jgi:hypothetical protein